MTLHEFITEQRERADRTLCVDTGTYAHRILDDLENLIASELISEAEAEAINVAPPYDINNPRQFTIPVTFKEGCARDYAIYIGDEGNTFKMFPDLGEQLAMALRIHGDIPQDTALLSYRH